MRILGFKPRQFTAMVLVFASLLLVSWDVFSYFYFGPDSTISVVVNDYAWGSPLGIFLTGFAVGALMVHFLKWAPLEKQL
jgi:hypothetical protein